VSKRTTTRWYIGAWAVYVVVLVAMIATTHSTGQVSPPTIGYIILAVAGTIMLVAWIGALIKLGMQSSWGWFVAVLLLHLFGLGIVGMVAYAVAGPEDEDLVVIRPRTPV
jgi:hypothetical protein